MVRDDPLRDARRVPTQQHNGRLVHGKPIPEVLKRSTLLQLYSGVLVANNDDYHVRRGRGRRGHRGRVRRDRHGRRNRQSIAHVTIEIFIALIS